MLQGVLIVIRCVGEVCDRMCGSSGGDGTIGEGRKSSVRINLNGHRHPLLKGGHLQ